MNIFISQVNTKKAVKFLFLFLMLSMNAYADPSMTIINHAKIPLNFKIGINPQVIPGLPTEFQLADQEKVTATVLDIGKESYLQVNGPHAENAFWGVQIVNHKIKFYGYISKKVAFSWQDQTITFCQPEDYKPAHHC